MGREVRGFCSLGLGGDEDDDIFFALVHVLFHVLFRVRVRTGVPNPARLWYKGSENGEAEEETFRVTFSWSSPKV